jgi:hypothetical protein
LSENTGRRELKTENRKERTKNRIGFKKDASEASSHSGK